jgi:N-acetylmuramoyl-L-alanine amidase CwlA
MPSALSRFVNVIEDFIPVGRKNRPGTRIRVSSITVHNTANTSPGADAKAHARFVKNTGHTLRADGAKNWVSWHFTVDDQVVIQHLPIHEEAWHAGPANKQSLGIEVCMHRGIDQEAANLRAAALVAGLLQDLGLTVAQVKTHRDWTGKNCPQLLLDNGVVSAKWRAFLQLVAAMKSVFEARRGSVMFDAAATRAARAAAVRGGTPARPASVSAAKSTAKTSEADHAEHDHAAMKIPARMLSKPAASATAASRGARPKAPSRTRRAR